jgi:cob(I)alamin adenosyltransferase
MKGYIQVYTGNGKCKTTAALGLVLRAVGAGLRVYLGQFLKKGDYSEIRILRARFPEVTVDQYGSGRFIRGRPAVEEIEDAHRGLHCLSVAMRGGQYDVIIADEANTAVGAGLLTEEDLLTLMNEKPDTVELILTGRGAGAGVVARADLVTEMKGVKHYFDAGVPGRPGIES